MTLWRQIVVRKCLSSPKVVTEPVLDILFDHKTVIYTLQVSFVFEIALLFVIGTSMTNLSFTLLLKLKLIFANIQGSGSRLCFHEWKSKSRKCALFFWA